MTIDDLALQFVGSEWIAAQDPVSLSDSRPGDDSIPSGIERRRALEELGRHATGDPGAEIMSGLFLRKSRQYLGLFLIPKGIGGCHRWARHSDPRWPRPVFRMETPGMGRRAVDRITTPRATLTSN